MRGGRKGIPAMEAGCIRKGPWLAEEDAVLRDYVNTYGARDWSSIRSKGLLPRTGKSCRLRWVNKLQPNLKTGCKFSEEEEGIVIEMQSRIGNKWAQIASHLPGRTDNDVKNFWSTRQKRLARLLNTALPTRSRRNQGKVPVSAELPNFEPNVKSGEFSQNEHGCQDIIDYDMCLCSNYAPPHPPYNQLLHDIPNLLSEDQEGLIEFSQFSLPCNFVCAESSQDMQIPQVPTFSDFEVGDHVVQIEHSGLPESSFGDFPDDDIFKGLY